MTDMIELSAYCAVDGFRIQTVSHLTVYAAWSKDRKSLLLVVDDESTGQHTKPRTPGDGANIVALFIISTPTGRDRNELADARVIDVACSIVHVKDSGRADGSFFSLGTSEMAEVGCALMQSME
ncbi:predicted protein [Histoplasma capsulatum var. duboisii H88]|uniref:Predicted protein n=2 Tax=Ajellomyces capsulatus TaxID=5037 RepID=F0UM03_AJEC8|nr:predicted protein [Histoplasma capsulatum H143]EGC48047.1 predicted protein [Histoplasma capsulatum var. duboisii H88]